MTINAFQWIFDRATDISISRQPNVAQTITRGNILRSVSTGGATWRFTVTLPDGIRWSELRPYVEAMDAAGRYTTADIQINAAGQSYISGYQGNATSMTLKYLSDSNPTTLTITASTGISSGYYFKAGDWVQLGTTGQVYSVVDDVAYGTNTVTVNRPVLETASSSTTYSAVLGANVKWTVLCSTMPEWKIFAYDQVSWSGSFVFYEVL
jgi:hypothetical protein